MFAFYFALYTWLDFALSHFRTSHFIIALRYLVVLQLSFRNPLLQVLSRTHYSLASVSSFRSHLSATSCP